MRVCLALVPGGLEVGVENSHVSFKSLPGMVLLGWFLWGCAPSPQTPDPTPLARPPLAVNPVTATPAAQLQIKATARPQPAKPTPRPPAQTKPRPGGPAAEAPKKTLVTRAPQGVRPHLPKPRKVPSPPRHPSSSPAPSSVSSPGVATVVPPNPVDPGPVEIELVPPQDLSLLHPAPPPPPQDPQAILQTPLAVHYGYTYSRSLNQLVRDGILEMSMVASGYTTLEFAFHNRGTRALHFYLFPGMIFKPMKTSNFASMILADVREIKLYPNSRDQFHIEGYSLDHKKPLPDERFPVLYRMEDNPDPHYPKTLRVMRALLTEDEAVPDRSDDYSRYRSTIIQFALWQASAGRYSQDSELHRALGPQDPKRFEALRELIYGEAERLNREANQF